MSDAFRVEVRALVAPSVVRKIDRCAEVSSRASSEIPRGKVVAHVLTAWAAGRQRTYEQWERDVEMQNDSLLD